LGRGYLGCACGGVDVAAGVRGDALRRDIAALDEKVRDRPAFVVSTLIRVLGLGR
jgi:hypothetical protein